MLDKFSQNWNLKFTNTNVELTFKEECMKLHYISSTIVTILLVLLCLYFVFLNTLPSYFIAFFITPLLPHIYTRNILFELASFVFIIYNIKEYTISEHFGCFLPSFLLQFFIWKRWEFFFLLNIVKMFVIHQQKDFLNSIFVICTYSFFAFLFEKDFRTNWISMKKHKE